MKSSSGGGSTHTPPFKVELLETTFNNLNTEGVPSVGNPGRFTVVVNVEGETDAAGNITNAPAGQVAIQLGNQSSVSESGTSTLSEGRQTFSFEISDNDERVAILREIAGTGRIRLAILKGSYRSKIVYMPILSAPTALTGLPARVTALERAGGGGGDFDLVLSPLPTLTALPAVGTPFSLVLQIRGAAHRPSGAFSVRMEGLALTVRSQPNLTDASTNATLGVVIPDTTTRNNLLRNARDGSLTVQVSLSSGNAREVSNVIHVPITPALRNREQTKYINPSNSGGQRIPTTLTFIPALSFMNLVAGRRYKIEIMAKIQVFSAAGDTEGFEVEVRHGREANVIPYRNALDQRRGASGSGNDVYVQYYASGEFTADAVVNPVQVLVRSIKRQLSNYDIVSKLTEVNDTDIVTVFGDPPAS